MSTELIEWERGGRQTTALHSTVYYTTHLELGMVLLFGHDWNNISRCETKDKRSEIRRGGSLGGNGRRKVLSSFEPAAKERPVTRETPT